MKLEQLLPRNPGLAGLFLALTVALAACAGGKCGPVRVTEVPLRSWHGVPVVTVVVNGNPLPMVVDTGAYSLIMLDDAVIRLGLPRSPVVSRLVGVGGSTTRWSAHANRIAIGNVTLMDEQVEVGDVPMRAADVAPPQGFLGAAILARYDVDLDLPAGRMTLYRGAPCDAPPGWTAPAVAVPLREPLPQARFVTLPVSIDDHTFSALIDSGATVTTLSVAAALDVVVNKDTLLQGRAVGEHGLGPDTPTAYLHRFQRIGIGGETFTDPLIAVGPLPLHAADMLLGSDFLRRRRVWISYSSNRFFFSSAASGGW